MTLVLNHSDFTNLVLQELFYFNILFDFFFNLFVVVTAKNENNILLTHL